MNDTPARRLRLSVAAIGMVAGLLGGIAGVAYASHQFSDVPDSNPHHDTINAVVDAGVATGFNDGTYRNQDNITRGSAADQLARGLSRIDEGTATTSGTADDTFVSVGTAAIRAGGTDSSHTGFIRVDGSAYATVASADCPCALTVRIHNDNANTNTSQISQGFATTCVILVDCGSVHVADVFPAGGTIAGNTFQVQAAIHTANGNASVSLSGHIIAEYIPFGGDPTNT